MNPWWGWWRAVNTPPTDDAATGGTVGVRSRFVDEEHVERDALLDAACPAGTCVDVCLCFHFVDEEGEDEN